MDTEHEIGRVDTRSIVVRLRASFITGAGANSTAVCGRQSLVNDRSRRGSEKDRTRRKTRR